MPLLNCPISFDHLNRIRQQADAMGVSAEEIGERIIAMAAEMLPVPDACMPETEKVLQ